MVRLLAQTPADPLMSAERRRPGRAASLLLLIVLSVGCGSTVPAQTRTAAHHPPAAELGQPESGLGDDGSAVQEEAVSTTAPSEDAPHAAMQDAQGLPAGRTGDRPEDPVDARSEPAPDSGRTAARPVTGSKLSIGFYYAEDGKESTRSIGASNDTPSFREAAEAMITTINAQGGVRGRRLDPIFHGIKLTGDRASEDQAACAKFTQDNRVFAVIAVGTNSDQFTACLAKAGVVLVYSGLTINNEQAFRRYPLLSEPISINLDRLVRAQVEGLAAQGWLRHAPGSDADVAGLPVKLGVIVRDTPSFRSTFEKVLKPAYARKGVPVEEEFFVSAKTQEAAADLDAAVLRFASRNVTHVTFLSTAGTTPGVFMLRATTQRYQPRYGFSSQDAPQVVLPNLPDKKGQLRGALGIGWLPFGDVVNPTDPGVAAPSYERCLKTLRSQSVSPTDANSAGLLSFVCDGFWFLEAALEAAPGSRLTAEQFVAGQEALGGRYAPAAVPAARFGPERHDGVSAIRYLAFHESCECYRYTSKPKPV